jgi:hypothetical protein
MDATTLMLSMLFSAIGVGFVVYARKAGVFVPAVAGLGLMVLPYFFSSALLMSVVCVVLIVLPFVFRDV